MNRASREAKKAAKAAQPLKNPGKSPRTAGNSLEATKKPRSLGIEHENAWHRRPVWRFADLDADHPIGAIGLEPDDFRRFHKALGSYETQTCAEIWSSQANGCNCYQVDEAHENITSRLVELSRDDETQLHTLRVTGAYRVFGVLRENVYHVLWIDPEHEMWPSVKKHT